MPLDLNSISCETFPESKVFFQCKNGSFFINTDCVVSFDYTRQPNSDRILELDSELEQVKKELETADTSDEVRNINYKIRELEKDIEFEKETKRMSRYIVSLDKSQVQDFIGNLKRAKENSVWSCAFSAGLRFDTTNSSIDNQIENREQALKDIEKMPKQPRAWELR